MVSMNSILPLIHKLSLARTLDVIQYIVADSVRKLVKADAVTFILKDGEHCYYADEHAIAPLWKGPLFPANQHISGWSMGHKQMVVIEDIRNDERIPQNLYAGTFVRSLIMVPVRSDNPLAAIGIYWAEFHRPRDDELEQLQIVANCTAIGMENAELVSKLNLQVLEQTSSLLAAQEAAKTANKTNTRFLSAASHDLRQPLQNLNTLCSVLMRKIHDPDVKQHVGKMHKSIQGMERLLSAVLNLNQIESGGIQPQLKNMDLQPLLSELQIDFEELALQKKLTLSIPTADLRVHSDPELLLQILRNLLGNALRYTEQGHVAIEYLAADNTLILGIRDTGPGIPDNKQAEVFDAFYRMDQHNKQGFGLGLSIVKALAELLNHPITLESTLGIGSFFSIQLPLSASDHKAVVMSNEPLLTTTQNHKASILYLEDDEDILEAMETLLNLEGYRVFSASTGGKAIAYTQDTQIPPDLIITDNRLADGENGLDVVKRLRELTQKPIPAIMITGYTESAVSTAALKTVQKVLHKPVDADLLLKEIAALVP
ncbi:MAG: signal transduction histidine kinase [Candidatus Endobugula sp.]|jgi:signal transduction histidine kinase